MISMDTAINSVMTAAEIVVAVQIFAHALPRRKGYLARAVAVTACPAIPSVTPRLAAMGVNKLAGRNSAVIKPNTPSPSE